MRERIGFGGVGVPPAALRLVEFKSRGKMPAPPKYSAGCSSRFEKRPKTVASTKMSHYPGS